MAKRYKRKTKDLLRKISSTIKANTAAITRKRVLSTTYGFNVGNPLSLYMRNKMDLGVVNSIYNVAMGSSNPAKSLEIAKRFIIQEGADYAFSDWAMFYFGGGLASYTRDNLGSYNTNYSRGDRMLERWNSELHNPVM